MTSVLLLAVAGVTFVVPGIQLAGTPTERLANGSFEDGFAFTAAGAVGSGWHWFQSGGRAVYGFSAETWAPVIYDGQRSQLIEIDTTGVEETDADCYAGIYQTVAVVPGETYELSLHGILRGLESDPDLCCFNYRVEYGFEHTGSGDWAAVDRWVEIPWDTVHPRLSPGSIDSYSTTVQATGSRLTVFIRALKKWATVDRVLDVNLDAISLKGAMPVDRANPSVQLTVPGYPVIGWSYRVPVVSSNDVGITRLEFYDGSTLVDSVDYEVGLLWLSHNFAWRPASTGGHTLKTVVYDVAGRKATREETVVVGGEGQFLTNGDFEGGFESMAKGAVGKGWGWFDSGGETAYRFQDDIWAPVVYDGQHSQLMVIDTFDRSGSDPDRYVGIYQKVDGLTPGATYQLSLYGTLRVLGDDEDQAGDNYRVQWGYDPAGGTDWTFVENWVEIPWDTVYPLLQPGEMSPHVASLQVPSADITLFVRAWKKWGTAQRELDLNLDAITLRGYEP